VWHSSSLDSRWRGSDEWGVVPRALPDSSPLDGELGWGYPPSPPLIHAETKPAHPRDGSGRSPMRLLIGEDRRSAARLARGNRRFVVSLPVPPPGASFEAVLPVAGGSCFFCRTPPSDDLIGAGSGDPSLAAAGRGAGGAVAGAPVRSWGFVEALSCLCPSWRIAVVVAAVAEPCGFPTTQSIPFLAARPGPADFGRGLRATARVPPDDRRAASRRR